MERQAAFSTISDHAKTGALLGLTYAAFIPLYTMLPSASAEEFTTRFAVVSSIWLTMRAPFVRKKLTALFNEKSPYTNNTAPVSREIAEDVETLSQKANLPEKIDVMLYRDDSSPLNAAANGHSIRIGRRLANYLDRGELKFIIAHEMAHIKTKDNDKYTLFAPAIFNSTLDCIATLITMPPLCAIPIASLLGQFGLFLAMRRHQEYRADRNALKLTGDFKSAAMAHAKIDPDCFGKGSRFEELFSSHPFGLDRLQAIERAAYGTTETPCADMAASLAEEDRKKRRFFCSPPEAFIEKAYRATYGKNDRPAVL